MKLSVFTVATPDLTPEQLAREAKNAGIEGIEWRYKDVPEAARNDKPSFWGNNLCSIPENAGPQELDRFKSAAADAGVESISVTPYLAVGDLEGTERVLAAAKHLGARYIRLGVAKYDRSVPYPELFERQRAYLKEAAALCRRYGVKGLIETHHFTIAASASGSYRLLEGLNPDDAGVLYDPGNMVYEGFENYRMGMELLGPYLAHVHVKNAGWMPADGDPEAEWQGSWRPVKTGMVPWRQVVEDLRAVGYDGYLGVEDFSGELGTADMLKAFATYMRSL